MVEDIKIRPTQVTSENQGENVADTKISQVPTSTLGSQIAEDRGALGRLEQQKDSGVRGLVGGIFAQAFDDLKKDSSFLSEIDEISGYDAGEQTALTRLQEIEGADVFSDSEVDEVISMIS